MARNIIISIIYPLPRPIKSGHSDGVRFRYGGGFQVSRNPTLGRWLSGRYDATLLSATPFSSVPSVRSLSTSSVPNWLSSTDRLLEHNNATVGVVHYRRNSGYECGRKEKKAGKGIRSNIRLYFDRLVSKISSVGMRCDAFTSGGSGSASTWLTNFLVTVNTQQIT